MSYYYIIEELLDLFRASFTRPTFRSFQTLVIGAILAPGRRTVTGILRAAGELADKHYSSYHRFLSKSRWNLWQTAWVLLKMILELIPQENKVRLLIDDTTSRRWGPRVWQKSCHRDAVRSTTNHTILCFGHKWVTLFVLVNLPFTKRPWALPIVSLLYRKRSEKIRRHRNLEALAKILIYKTIRKFPERTFEVTGDGGYSSNEFCGWCHQFGSELISRLRLDSVLHDDPAPRVVGQKGRPVKKGLRQSSFSEKVKQARSDDWTYGKVTWHSEKEKNARWLTGLGARYKSNTSSQKLRWVLVQYTESEDWDQVLEWQCFFSTDINASPSSILEAYVTRWTLEVTYQEVREHLGFETSKNWCENSIKRTTPSLFALFTFVTLCFEKICRIETPLPRQEAWYTKSELTFSDAMICVRKALWARLILPNSSETSAVIKIDRSRWTFLTERLFATL